MLPKPLNLLPLRKQKLSSSKVILGIDEVGRGPWAGPLVVGAVVLGTQRPEWDNLTDSKKLSAKKRSALSKIILDQAQATGLGWVSANELDRYGLSNALKLANRRAVKQVLATKIVFDGIIIDGTVNFLADTPLTHKVTILKKADFLIKEVSAASIIAKVARDNYMIRLAEKYPAYGFEKHVGYGTALHKQALLEHGICPEHRKSFRPIHDLIEQGCEIVTEQADYTYTESQISPDTTTGRGQHGEQIVIDYLVRQSHKIIAHNYKTKTCEIDIISTYANKIYFTEVKYRKQNSHGSALDQITPAKHGRMQYATKVFFQQHPEFTKYQPVLAAASVSGENYQLEDWLELN